MFSFTKKSFSFKVYITGNREFLPRKPQICLIHSSKLQDKFSVSHCEIQKPQCGIYISQCGIQISLCETENKQGRLKEYFRRKERTVHLILHLKNKKGVYEPCNSSYTPIYRDCELSSVVYHTFTRFSGATYNGSDGVMWKASYQA
jgi:hypothetical protein